MTQNFCFLSFTDTICLSFNFLLRMNYIVLQQRRPKFDQRYWLHASYERSCLLCVIAKKQEQGRHQSTGHERAKQYIDTCTIWLQDLYVNWFVKEIWFWTVWWAALSVFRLWPDQPVIPQTGQAFGSSLLQNLAKPGQNASLTENRLCLVFSLEMENTSTASAALPPTASDLRLEAQKSLFRRRRKICLGYFQLHTLSMRNKGSLLTEG